MINKQQEQSVIDNNKRRTHFLRIISMITVSNTEEGGRQVDLVFPPELDNQHYQILARNPMTDKDGHIGSDVIIKLISSRDIAEHLANKYPADEIVDNRINVELYPRDSETHQRVNALLTQWHQYEQDKTVAQKANNLAKIAQRKQEIEAERIRREPERKQKAKQMKDKKEKERKDGIANRRKYANAQGFEFDEKKGEIVRGNDGKFKKKETPTPPENPGGNDNGGRRNN